MNCTLGDAHSVTGIAGSVGGGRSAACIVEERLSGFNELPSRVRRVHEVLVKHRSYE